MCRWVSIMPGITMPPAASISSVPSGTASPTPTAAIRSPVTRTSWPDRTVRLASTVRTVALRKTTLIGALLDLPDRRPLYGHRGTAVTVAHAGCAVNVRAVTVRGAVVVRSVAACPQGGREALP